MVAMAEEKESLARTQLPYRAEYCKTSRARCKKCNEPMQSGSLKVASSTKSRFHDGFDYHYHHVECFFRVKRPASVAEIGHYETLKYDDQKMLEEAIETNGRSLFSANGSQELKGASELSSKKKKRDASTSEIVNYDDFLIEYAKSNRSTCVKCEQKIDKALIRIGKLDYNAETSFKGAPIPRWYHVDCFANSLEKVEFDGDINKVKGYADLEKDDQKMLKKAIKPVKLSVGSMQSSIKKVKKENDGDNEEDQLLRKQSDRFFRLREQVSSMKRKDIECMLEHMNQKHDYKNSGSLIDMATDVLLFGPIKKCPQCKQTGHIQLRTSRYICTSTTPEGINCSYESSEPKRGVPDIPEQLSDAYVFLEKYKFKEGKRIFPSKLLKAVEEKEAETNNTIVENGPLEGITIGITSWQAIDANKTKVQKKVMTLGGKLVTALDRSIFVILSSEEELKKDTPKIEVAKALDVPFATETFLFKIESRDDVVRELSKCLINKWDGDLKERFETMRKAVSNGSPIKQE